MNTNKDTIIAFDLHSVVFKANIQEMLHILWQWPKKLKLLLCGLNLKLIWKAFRLLLNDPTDEEFFALFQSYCPALLPLIVKLFNAFKPIDKTIDILKELKSQGYILHIASNIGPRRFTALQNRYPDIIGLFEKATINNGNIENLIKKPHPEFFEKYLRDNNPEHRPVIFVDDKLRNITAAQKHGIQGIQFHSPEQLRKALTEMHILS
jgi:FMN phosphatase YigB (HAD superfamily)